MALYGTAVYGSTLYGATGPSGNPIITLAEAKSWLRKSSPEDNAEILTLLDVVSEACERYTRRTWRATTRTETHNSDDSPYLQLRRTPVIGIGNVTVYGTTVSAATYTLDARTGRLWAGRYTDDACWPEGIQHITVTYTAGPDSVPEHIKHGCKLLLAHMWETQRGGSNLPRRSGAEDEVNPVLSFLPPRVRQAWGVPRVLVR